ncbi:hypothetical protein JOD52_001451 [Brachybacterium muris]|uniref:hypothetical protein n=2 Tax=Brachybacterium muris TaxID=219301 RepID=UPI0019598E8B|nr:hypothetical protein [Brachybacterium muris]MBM7500611.1 hypothetical protein [Brachybacterium muris]
MNEHDGMNEDDEKIGGAVPGPVIGAMFDAVAVLSASWSEDDDGLAAALTAMDAGEARSVIGVMPWLVKFALMANPGTDPRAFLAAVHGDLVRLAAGEG